MHCSSPDCPAVAELAVLDATATCLTLFHSQLEESASEAGVKGQPSVDLAPSAMRPVRSFKPTCIGADSLSQSVFIMAAYCLSLGLGLRVRACAFQRRMVAIAPLYRLLQRFWKPRQRPWLRSQSLLAVCQNLSSMPKDFLRMAAAP